MANYKDVAEVGSFTSPASVTGLPSKKLYIFSSRSDVQTQNQSQAMKFGFESPSAYPNIVRCSYNMNYANMTKSFNEIWKMALDRHGVKKVD
jgi:hypothetical protein